MRNPYWTHIREPLVKYRPTKIWEGDNYQVRKGIKWNNTTMDTNRTPALSPKSSTIT